MWRVVFSNVLILVAHCAFQLLGLLVVYAACRLLVALELESWVFPVFLVGMPVTLIAAVIATIRLGRALKL